MILFVVGFTHLLNKKSKVAMLMGDICKVTLIIDVQRVQEDKVGDGEECKNKRAKR